MESLQDGSAEFTVTTEEFGFDAKTGSKLYIHGEMGIELKVLMPGLFLHQTTNKTLQSMIIVLESSRRKRFDQTVLRVFDRSDTAQCQIRH